MKLRINDELRIPPLKIKRISVFQMGEEYKGICYFDWKGITYVVPSEYELYSIYIELEEEKKDFILLYALKYGSYKGSYKTILKKEITSMFPDTWDTDIVSKWCEEETEKTLSLCRALP